MRMGRFAAGLAAIALTFTAAGAAPIQAGKGKEDTVVVRADVENKQILVAITEDGVASVTQDRASSSPATAATVATSAMSSTSNSSTHDKQPASSDHEIRSWSGLVSRSHRGGPS